MEKIKFYLALWGGKFFIWFFKITGREKSDKPGMASLRLDINFLKKVSKPPLVICVSGTNGKTSISLLLTSIFRKQGYRVANNEGGANANAGHAFLMLQSVSIFNKSTVDIAVIETDEKLTTFSVPQLQPDYLIVNNLSRDSMFSNANPEYIAERIIKASQQVPDTTMIINADDPLCYGLGSHNKSIYFGVTDCKTEKFTPYLEDFAYCPKCYHKPTYLFKNYNHIGDFYCTHCDFKAHERDYFVSKFSDDYIWVQEKEGEYRYPIISSSVYNMYNTVTVISILRDLNYSPEQINELLSTTTITKTREDKMVVNGVEIQLLTSKTQNPFATSTIARAIANIPGRKTLILLYDEVLAPGHFETSAYLYDCDFEAFNNDSIDRIIISGDRCLDTNTRLKIAGVDARKIVISERFEDIANDVEYDGLEKVIIVKDIYKESDRIARSIASGIEKNILSGGIKNDN